MCMHSVTTENLEKYNGTIAYKGMAWNGEHWETPFYPIVPTNNKLIAIGKVDIKTIRAIISDTERIIKSLKGGAIHCFKNAYTFKEEYPSYTREDGLLEKVFKVRGKNCIAYNNNEIAFDEVEFLDPLDPPE